MMNMEGYGRAQSLPLSNVIIGFGWRHGGQSTKTSVNITGLQSAIRIRNFPHMCKSGKVPYVCYYFVN
jgi:hypothetical protein